MSSGTSVYPSLDGSGTYAQIDSDNLSSPPVSSLAFYNHRDGTTEVSPCIPTRPVSTEAKYQKLKSSVKKLKKYTRYLLMILAIMVLVLVATSVVVAVKMGPQIQKVWGQLLGMSDSDNQGTLAPKTAKSLAEERREKGFSYCAEPSSVGECARAINELYSSQHRRFKEDEKADDKLDMDLEIVRNSLQSHLEELVIYRWRPSAHLILDRKASLNSKGDQDSLAWQEPLEGAPMRKLELKPESRHIRILYSGFYYVYSHVIFGGDDAYGKNEHFTFYIMKNYRVGDGEQTKLLETNDALGASDISAGLQGIFRFKENDTISVRSTAKYIKNGTDQEMIYFGAFLI